MSNAPMATRMTPRSAQASTMTPTGAPIAAPVRNGHRIFRWCCPQVPAVEALYNRAESDDKRHGLQRREQLQPNSSSDETIGKPSNLRRECGGKSAAHEYR